jgi:hypothetical protein
LFHVLLADFSRKSGLRDTLSSDVLRKQPLGAWFSSSGFGVGAMAAGDRTPGHLNK